MKKYHTLIFILSIILSFGTVFSESFPHGFRGDVIIEDGSNPNGLTLIGRVNGVATGSCTIEDGKYDIVVTSSSYNSKVSFYLGDEKASENFDFSIFELTNANITFDTTMGVGDCGDGICSGDDCSSCPIDCVITECIGNNICDTEIGEDCVVAEVDCGPCSPVCGDGTCEEGESCSNCASDCGSCSGSGGGSSGGVSSSSNTISDNNSLKNNEISEESNEDIETGNIPSIDELNKMEEAKEENQEGFFAPITGAVSGVLGRTTISVVAIFLILLILILLIVVFQRKKSASKI